MTLAATTPPEIEAACDRLLARGVLYRALKLGLDRPGEALLAAFFEPGGRAALARAAERLNGAAGGELAPAVESLQALAAPTLDELHRSHERLFGHTLRGRVCPYECEYGRQALLQQAQELADLAGFYAAFGFRAREARHERPDHVACEFEFLELLARKECWALDNDDDEMADVTRTAARRFLRDHLARFGRAFARALQDAAPGEFYGALGALCEAVLHADCRRLEVPLGPEVLELRSTAPDGVPMACGDDEPEELVQLGGGAARRDPGGPVRSPREETGGPAPGAPGPLADRAPRARRSRSR